MGDGRACPRCEREAGEEASFCMYCGAALAAGVTGPAAGSGQGGYPVACAEAIPSQRRFLILTLGITGKLLIAAGLTLLAIYLLVWRGESDDGPLALARRYMRALEEKDIDSYLDCFAENGLSSEDNLLLENLDVDPREWLELGFQFMEVVFRDVHLEVEYEGDNDATVVTTSGTLIMSVLGMENEVDLSEEPMRFQMTRRGGRWYLVDDPLPNPSVPEFFHGEGDLELDFEDLGLPEIWEDFLKDPDLRNWEELREWMEERLEEGGNTADQPA